jgi:hypothetical protein
MVWSYALWALVLLVFAAFLLLRHATCPHFIGFTSSHPIPATVHLGQAFDVRIPGNRCAIDGGYVIQCGDGGPSPSPWRWTILAILAALPFLIPLVRRLATRVRRPIGPAAPTTGTSLLWAAAVLTVVLTVQVGYWYAEGDRFCGTADQGTARASLLPPAPRCSYPDIQHVEGGVYGLEWVTIAIIAVLLVLGIAIRLTRRTPAV